VGLAWAEVVLFAVWYTSLFCVVIGMHQIVKICCM
jgi:hypothetical protein